MKHFKGRQILLLGLVALVIVAGYYRWTLENSGEAVPAMMDALPAEEGEGAIAVDGDGNKIETAASGSVSETDAAEGNASGYFAMSRQNRDVARSESMEVFRSVISDSNADQTSKEQAQVSLTRGAEDMAKESAIEGLVKAKGFEDCFVTLDDSGVNVVVKGAPLEKETVAQIKDIVISKTGLKAANIRISNAH